MIQLRYYQREAVEAIYNHLRTRDDNPCVEIPTGGGKTPVIATLCRDAVTQWNGRVLVLSHVKELVDQAAKTLPKVCPEVKVGVYSAGLKRRELDAPVLVAGIQSIYKLACDVGPVDLVIIDEAHMIPPDGEGMYQTFLREAKIVNPQIRVIGLTATPYRLGHGMICQPDHFLNAICYRIGVRELIAQGFLCPLVTKAGESKADMTAVHVRAGEFVESEAEAAMLAIVEAACTEIAAKTADRKAILIFCQGVDHGKAVKKTLQEKHGIESCLVASRKDDGDVDDRDATIARFKGEAGGLFDADAKPLRVLINVNMLTTGFDAPHIDAVVLLRATMSPGLYYQMVGRGFRLHPDKRDCLVLDFGDNCLRHGPVDAIQIKEKEGTGTGVAPAKECPDCRAVVAAGYAVCPDCGHEFPPPEKKRHDTKPSDAPVVTPPPSVEKWPVVDVRYRVHQKKATEDNPYPTPTLRVDYRVAMNLTFSEWICLEHTGWVQSKAREWWAKRSCDPCPTTVEEAWILADAGSLCKTLSITVKETFGEKFPRIIDYELGPKGEAREDSWQPSQSDDDEEVPF